MPASALTWCKLRGWKQKHLSCAAPFAHHVGQEPDGEAAALFDHQLLTGSTILSGSGASSPQLAVTSSPRPTLTATTDKKRHSCFCNRQRAAVLCTSHVPAAASMREQQSSKSASFVKGGSEKLPSNEAMTEAAEARQCPGTGDALGRSSHLLPSHREPCCVSETFHLLDMPQPLVAPGIRGQSLRAAHFVRAPNRSEAGKTSGSQLLRSTYIAFCMEAWSHITQTSFGPRCSPTRYRPTFHKWPATQDLVR